MIYTYDQVKAVHLELTDRCNAACPMCPRYDQRTGEESSKVHNTQLYLDDIQTLIPEDLVRQINRVNFCGNYGDPIVAKDLQVIISYFRAFNPQMRVEVNTNGSARSADWWKALAVILGPNEAQGGVWFGLDGLSDTNHLYRRNTNWDIIMRNVEAYISAGGIAHWNFIAFKHNEHQIDEARALAKSMGFKHFNVKLTGRFQQNQRFPVMSKGEHLYDLEPAGAERHQRPPEKSKSDRIEANIEQLRRDGQIQAPTIECVAQEESCIYVSARGKVYPCCWLGDADGNDPQVNFEDQDGTIRSVVEGNDFQSIQDSWATGSIQKCVQFCGVNETDDKVKHGPDYAIHEQL